MNRSKTVEQDTQSVKSTTLVSNSQEQSTASTLEILHNGESISHYEDNMRVATISDSTRMLLIALGKLNDVYNILSEWSNGLYKCDDGEALLEKYINKPDSEYIDGIHKLIEINIKEARGVRTSTEI